MICIIGEQGVWDAVKPLGIEVKTADTRENMLNILNEISITYYEIVFLSEKLARIIEDLLPDYLNNPGLNLVLIPSPIDPDIKDKDTLSYKYLKKIVEKSMGVDLLNN